MESIRSKRIENLENAALDETSAASSLVSSIRSASAAAEKTPLESSVVVAPSSGISRKVTIKADMDGVDVAEAVKRVSAKENAYQTALAAGRQIFQYFNHRFLEIEANLPEEVVRLAD